MPFTQCKDMVRPIVLVFCCFFFSGSWHLGSDALAPVAPRISRRSLVFGGTASFVAAAAATIGGGGGVTQPASPATLSLNEAVEWIDAFCDKTFLHAVVASEYRFLYRGEESVLGIQALQQRPDLLDFETYGSSTALQHFQKLEILMKNQPVRPSNGHLGTTSKTAAAGWGEACSVWPKNGSDFAWFQFGGLFYPRNLQLDALLINGRDCGQENLEDVLVTPSSEVLFSADEYLVVPAGLDSDLRSKLQESFLI